MTKHRARRRTSNVPGRLTLVFGVAALAGVMMACHALAQPPVVGGTAIPDESGTVGADPSGTGAANEGNVARPSGAAAMPAAETAIPANPIEIMNALGYGFASAFIAASVIAAWCAIERLVVLRRRRVIPRAFVDRFLMHLRTGRMDKVEAIAICQQNHSPMSDVFLHGVRKWGRPSVEIEQAVIDGGERQVSLLKKRLRVLNGVATITPLIGLLGTVKGMITAFNDIATANAMGQAQELAEGIATALWTTAVGLSIAIPALTTYMYLAGRIDALVMEMDRLGQELVHLISAEALRERAMTEQEAPTRPRRGAPAGGGTQGGPSQTGPAQTG